MVAANGIDASCDRYVIATNIELVAGGDVNLRQAEVRNDFGKTGHIKVTGRQIDIEGATIIDDDPHPKVPDYAEMNGNKQVPHTGVNGVIGTPAVDD